MDITLNDHLRAFLERAVASGRYGSVDEAVGEALRLLEEREVKIAALRREIERGDASGEPVPFDPEHIKRNGRARLSRRRA